MNAFGFYFVYVYSYNNKHKLNLQSQTLNSRDFILTPQGDLNY